MSGDLSPTVQIWALAFGFLGTCFSGIMAYLLTKLNTKAAASERAADRAAVASEKAAERAAEVKEALAATTTAQDAKLETIAKTGQETHLLVNGGKGDSLALIAQVSRVLADLTDDPNTEAAARLAESNLRAHSQQMRDMAEAANKPSIE